MIFLWLLFYYITSILLYIHELEDYLIVSPNQAQQKSAQHNGYTKGLPDTCRNGSADKAAFPDYLPPVLNRQVCEDT